MPTVYAYCRVSTDDQTNDNQSSEMAGAGFAITPQNTFNDTISGSTAAANRPAFQAMLAKLHSDDVVVVTKLDRLGRNAMDVRNTVENFTTMGVKVHCLALGGLDLTSAAGKMTMGVIAAIAEFERDMLIERTNAGIARAKAQGTHCGRPPSLDEDTRAVALARIQDGESIASISRDLSVTRQVLMRLKNNTWPTDSTPG